MPQKIYTKNYGTLEVEHSWAITPKMNEDGKMIRVGGHVAKLTNGVYVHITGLPFKNEQEIKEILCAPELKSIRDDAIEWFRNRGSEEEAPLPKIMFDENGYPYYEDGTPVEKMDELYHCLKPGPILTAAIVGLNNKLEAERSAPTLKDRTMPATKKAKKSVKSKTRTKASKDKETLVAPQQVVV